MWLVVWMMVVSRQYTGPRDLKRQKCRQMIDSQDRRIDYDAS